MAQYKIREVKFRGMDKGILCQSPEHPCPDSPAGTCPCALISIWNFLVLNQQAPWKAEGRDQFKTAIQIRNYIYKQCSNGIDLLLKSDHFKRLNIGERRPGILKQMSLLQTGIELVTDPSSAVNFIITDASALFGVLGITLVHGHASKEQEATTSLTDIGISSLLRSLGDDELGVLYLNGHFSVVLKKDNILLTLQTQENVLTNLPDATWKRLTLMEGDSFYLTSRFSPTKRQPNFEGANNWYMGNIEEKFGSSKGSCQEDDQMASQNLKRRINTDNDGYVSNLGRNPEQETTRPDLSESCCELPLFIEREMKTSEIASNFFTFLLKFTKCGHSKPYFDGIFKSIEYQGVPNISVPYELIERYDKRLAVAIRDQSPRINSDLQKSFVCYLQLHKFQMSNLEEVAEIEILDLPKPKSTRSFGEFVLDHKMTEYYELYGGLVRNSTAYDGRRMGLGYLCHILANHEAGQCYRGAWEESDMKVRNDSEFFIDKEAEFQLTQEGGVADLLHYCSIIFPRFRDNNGQLPIYFDEFQTDCLTMPDPRTPAYRRFLMLARSAFPFKAPTARSTLICDIYRLASAKMVMGRPYASLNNKKCLVEWRESLKMLAPFKGIYEYNNGDGLYVIDKWGCTYWFLLQFSRNFIEHVLGHLKKLVTLHNITVVELMLSHQLREYLAQFIRYFVYNCDIDDVFHSAWAAFEASDCKDKPQSNSSMNAVIQTQDCAEPNTKNDMDPLLHVVSAGSSVPCLEILIEAHANVNSEIEGCPLHLAARSGNIEVIKCLLKAGADTDICNDDGLKPIEIAALRNNNEAVKILFPLTTPMPSVPDWSIDGIKEYLSSEVVKGKGELDRPIFQFQKPGSLVRPQPELSSEAKMKLLEATTSGDSAFISKDYIRAVDAYTQAIELNPKDALLWSNRSICWLMVGIPENALADAVHCEELRPDWATARYREGSALHVLERFYEAANAFFVGAHLAPEDMSYVKAFRDAVEAGRKKDGIEVKLAKVVV